MQKSRFRQTRTLGAIAALLATPLAAAAGPLCEPFSELAIHLEENRTDGDGEIVLVAKGDEDGLRRLRITAPNGKQYEFRAPKSGIGILQFVFESSEPTDLQEIFDSFPAGAYAVRGTTVEGDCLNGSATLSHAAAPAPSILSPAEGAVVAPDAFVVTWSPVAGVAGYLVELTNEDSGQELRIDLDASETRFEVPSDWLVPGTPYEVIVAATSAATGNVASNQVIVTTEP